MAGAVLAILVGVPAAVSAAPDIDGGKGPRCADLVDTNDLSDASYTFEGGRYVVNARLELDARACSNLDYTFYVLSEDGLTEIDSSSVATPGVDASTGAPFVTLTLDLGESAPNVIATYATSSRNGKVLDRGPDEGFITLNAESAPAGRGYQ